MAIECTNQHPTKTNLKTIQEYLRERQQYDQHRYNFDLEGLHEWFSESNPDISFAFVLADGLRDGDLNQAVLSGHTDPSMLLTICAPLFLDEYDSNLTRLDGSRNGPVGLFNNAFAIVDCLSAGRFNNAQILRDQAVQLLNQRAYEDQDTYAEDLELQKDPENYVEIIPQRLFVFAHELMGQRAGQEKQPWEIWDIVGDQDYIKAARAVYTEDMDEAAQTLCQLCNLHVQYSNPFPADDENDHLIGFEFDTPIRAIWPTEIFAWLRLRQERGLPLPEVEHPLLDQPLGRFEPNIPTQWEYKPWFVELVQKLVAYHPRYADLPRMVFEQP